MTETSTAPQSAVQNAGATSDFVRRQLPWIIAGVALVFYVCTLARSVSPAGLPELVRAAGWSWRPTLVEPLHFLLTYPIRWLPVGWQGIGMNLFGAVCAAGALGLLARSVAILPHDRTRDQRFMERSDYSWLTIPAAWLPPVLAAAVCGLQLSFWEQSVIATGESLDILLFAFVVRNLLEYRIDQKESRLTIASLVYGAGMTSNFAMIGFLPVFVAAIVWLRGLSFFKVRFLVRMALFGLAGLSLYLLLPLINSLSGKMEQSFLELLRINLGMQKDMLARFPRPWHDYVTWLLLGLTSLAPILFISIKWPASFGDVSAAGTALTNLMMHVIHALLLVAVAAVVFDLQFSPRKLVGPMGYVMLPFYFLGALSLGYFVGYFMLIFRAHPGGKGWRRPSAIGLVTNRVIAGAIWVALIAMPAALIYRNLPQIRANARPYLSQMGVFQAQTLKEVAPQGAIVLSDDPYRLFSVDAALRRSGGAQHYVLVDTTSLPWPGYHQHLSERYPQQWVQPPADVKLSMMLDPFRLAQLLAYLSQSRPIYYLHPSFGYYFEYFYLKPEKLVYQLRQYPTNSIEAPLLTAEELTAQERFWSDFKSSALAPLVGEMKRLRVRDEPNLSLALAGSIYSRSVNDFAVSLQRAGEFEKAGNWFETALELNPQNPSAQINLDYNRLLRAGRRDNPEPSKEARERLAPYGGNFEAILGANGALDEPNVCFRLAEVFARGRNFRQAAQQVMRVVHFNPDNLSAQMALVTMYNQLQLPDRALAGISEIRTRFATNLVNHPAQLELAQAEAFAYLGRRELPTAEKILVSAQKEYPQNAEPFSTLAEIYVNHGQITNALKVLDQALQNQPNEPSLLNQYARLMILSTNYQGAIPYLDRALELNQKDLFALLNRAIAHLKIDQLESAQRDYEALEAMVPNVSPVCYGLHEIHYRKKHRKSAIKYAEQFLKTAPPGSPEVQELRGRLAKLESGTF